MDEEPADISVPAVPGDRETRLLVCSVVQSGSMFGYQDVT